MERKDARERSPRDARERSKALRTLETVQQLFEPPENAAILAFSFLAPSLALGLGDPVACRRSASFKSWPAARSWGFPNVGTSRFGASGLLPGPKEIKTGKQDVSRGASHGWARARPARRPLAPKRRLTMLDAVDLSPLMGLSGPSFRDQRFQHHSPMG